jgi:hypothetical protein
MVDSVNQQLRSIDRLVELSDIRAVLLSANVREYLTESRVLKPDIAPDFARSNMTYAPILAGPGRCDVPRKQPFATFLARGLSSAWRVLDHHAMNAPNSRCRRWRLAGINGFLAGSGGAQLWETPLIRVICPIGNTCAM